MLKHHSSFFTFTSILERADGTLYDLMQGPMWSLPVVLLLGHSLDHMKPYFKGYGGGGLKDDSVWHDGKRSYSPQHLLELLALSDAAIRANGGIPDTVHQSLQNDPHFHSMHPQVQAALVIIYWLADKLLEWKNHPVAPRADVVYLPEALSYEEEWPFSRTPDDEDIEAGGSWGEYEWVDDFRQKYFWWQALRMEEWGDTPDGWLRLKPEEPHGPK